MIYSNCDGFFFLFLEYRSVDKYNASLGHKINHNSEPNIDFGFIDHPRFGRVRTIETTEDLQAGDELFCEYSPSIEGNTFLRQVYKDFINYLDLEEGEEKTEYLNEIKTDYKRIVHNMLAFDPDKKYNKPTKK